MAELYELEKRYEKIPQEMKQQRRWICYALNVRGNESFKIPVAPFANGSSLVGAVSTDNNTWGEFDKALAFCSENNLEGLGFELNDSGMFAIDLDNKPNEEGNVLPQNEFQSMVNDFVATLDSYTEWSASGNGVHIICYGSVPANLPKFPFLEIYEGAKFFVMTGNAIRRSLIKEVSTKLTMLCEKYSTKKEKKEKKYEVSMETLSDEQVMQAMSTSKQSAKISKLFRGDFSDYESKDKAKQALCNFIAYYSHCNREQVSRIFAKSALVDDEWKNQVDEFVATSIDTCSALNIKTTKKDELNENAIKPSPINEMNIDENGEPIFRISDKIKQRKTYSLDDTGNALRFYDYFGEHFHWNATDKTYMFWTGKTWVYDTKGIIRKYANELIKILKEEAKQILEQVNEASDEYAKKRLLKMLSDAEKNITRISNKSGKDAMLNEMQYLSEIPVETTDFNKNPYLLNTESGIVDLKTGKILPFDRKEMLSYNTKMTVSFEEPTEWLKCLHTIFEYENPKDTEEVIECLRRCFGLTLTGDTSEQKFFLLHGEGSNGKSTILNVLQNVMGDYFNTIDSSQLMVTKNQSVAIQNSLAELVGTRFLSTQETDEGARLSEPIVKHMTGDEVVNAQKKYGKPFYFKPVFKLWMSTNNLPIIRGKDYGIWRRIFLFPFKKQFKDEEKDKDMPNKLAAEYPKILGWCIKGAVDYLADRDLKEPSYLLNEKHRYQEDLDTVFQFINAECFVEEGKATLKRTVYDAYKEWAKRSSLPALSEPKFKNEMIKKGYPLITNAKDHGQYYDKIGIVDNGFGASATSKNNFEFEEETPW